MKSVMATAQAMAGYRKQIDLAFDKLRDHEVRIVETRAQEKDDMDRVDFLLAKERERAKELDRKIVELKAIAEDLGEK